MKRTNIYVSTIAADAEEVIKKYGFGIELGQFCTAAAMEDEAIRKSTADLLASLDSPRAVLHAPFNELFPAAIDPQAVMLAEERYRQAYDTAASFGIDRMVVHSGYMPFVYFKEWHIEKSIKFWNRYMADKPGNFQLYIENVLEDEPRMMADMMKEIKDERIHICLDIGHAACMSDVPVEEWISVLSPYIGHLHMHNNNGSYDDHAPIDKGKIDIAKTISAIKNCCSPDVTFTLESMDSTASALWLEHREGITDE